MSHLHLDFETYCDLDIKQVGLDNYCAHPSLEILLTAWAIEDEEAMQNVGEESGLGIIRMAEQQGFTFVAFNAAFERAVLCAKGIDIPPERWICAQAWAYSMAFFGGLREVGDQLGIATDAKKLKSGTRLITKFCKPRKPTKNNDATRWTPEAAPDDWEEFKLYNRQDVIAEAAICRRLEQYPLNDVQRTEYVWDARVNERGLPIDLELVEACCAAYETELAHLRAEMDRLTGLENSNSRDQLLGWINAGTHHILNPLPDLTKATVRKALEDPELPSIVRQVLELRQEMSRASPKKWLALKRATSADGRLRNCFQLWGAGRTQRWAGRIYQPQNLPWPEVPMNGLPEFMKAAENSTVRLLHDSVMAPLVSLIRNAVTAPRGKMLVVVDLSSIESVVIGYFAGCETINQVFAEGRDLYRHFGSMVYGKPEVDVTKEERQFCKPPVLGCGYGLGPKGLVQYGASMGVELDEERATTLVNFYRDTYREIPTMWEWLENVCMILTTLPPRQTMFDGYGMRIHCDEEYLRITKPNGWAISYYLPMVTVNKWGRECFSYMGKNQHTTKWERLFGRGAGITENIVQSVARDILMHGMQLIEAEGLEIVGHVHDEVIVECDEGRAQEVLNTVIRCLTTRPEWAPNIWLGAEGKIVKRYEK